MLTVNVQYSHTHYLFDAHEVMAMGDNGEIDTIHIHREGYESRIFTEGMIYIMNSEGKTIYKYDLRRPVLQEPTGK